MQRTDVRTRARDLDGALTGLLVMGREIVGAAYAAIGILDRGRLQLEHFVTAGLDERSRERIGAHPRGRGVLGLLIVDPRPLRIDDLLQDPRRYGFPRRHPVMRTFLGAPIVLGGEACGNLYFAEKQGGAFDDADERAVISIASLAADIVEDARSRPSGAR